MERYILECAEIHQKVVFQADTPLEALKEFASRVGYTIIIEEDKTQEECLMEFLKNGYIECPRCGLGVEVDTSICGECGWPNPASKAV